MGEEVKLTVAEYLGDEMFDLYKSKHPAVDHETTVIEVSEYEAIHGLSIPIIESTDIYAKSAVVRGINVTNFEKWAYGKNGPFIRIAFVPELNRVYAYRY